MLLPQGGAGLSRPPLADAEDLLGHRRRDASEPPRAAHRRCGAGDAGGRLRVRRALGGIGDDRRSDAGRDPALFRAGAVGHGRPRPPSEAPGRSPSTRGSSTRMPGRWSTRSPTSSGWGRSRGSGCSCSSPRSSRRRGRRPSRCRVGSRGSRSRATTARSSASSRRRSPSSRSPRRRAERRSAHGACIVTRAAAPGSRRYTTWALLLERWPSRPKAAAC